MEEKNKKVLVPTIIAVVTLILLTVGATYAYFRVATRNDFGTPTIDASTPSIGSVALSTGSNLTMNLTAEEMMQIVEVDEYCLEDAEEGGYDPSECYLYFDEEYYASSTGTKVAATTEKIGTATVTGDGVYNCTYTLTIDDNENSLYDAFQTYNNKSTGQVLLTVNGTKYDFNTANLFPLTIDGEMEGINASNPQYITAQLKLVNSASIDQSNLSGQNITLTFGVEDFSCTAVEEQEQTAVNYILANASEEELWDSTLEDDGYRYVGTNPNNYVCFGYSDAETDCDFTVAENTDKYAYRVIGIFDNEQGVDHVKLIKKEAENETSFNANPGSIYMQDNAWANRIATWNYNLTNTTRYETGSLYYSKNKIQETYLHEMNRSTKTNTIGEWDILSTNVSLMYVSDYLLSLGSIEANQDFTTSWMYLRNNDNNLPESEFCSTYGEWTMSLDYTGIDTYSEITSNYFVAEGVYSDVSDGAGCDYYVRTVFYLTSDTTMSGDGTLESPFIVNK